MFGKGQVGFRLCLGKVGLGLGCVWERFRLHLERVRLGLGCILGRSG